MLAMVGGALVGVAAGVAIVGATALTGGMAAVAIAGAVAGGGLAGGQIMSGLQTIFDLPEPTSGTLAIGSPNIFVNARPAIRAELSSASSCSGLPFNHPPWPASVTVREGSATVLMNGQPASRLKSKLACGAHIKTGSHNVLIGGEETSTGFIFDLEAWTKTGLEVLGLGALIGAGAFAAAAGVAAFGAFVGVGALGFAGMEGVGAIGDAIGPGYRDLLQGVVGMGLVVASPKLASEGQVVSDRSRITRLSNEGRIDEARAILKPHVDAGDANAIVRRLDVGTQGKQGYLWSGNKVAAGQYAQAHGGTVLEGTPGGRVIDDWDYLNTNMPWDKGGEQVWGGASAKYSRGLTGDVEALQSPSRAGGGYVFKKYELPEVEAGKVSGRITSFQEKVVLPDKGNWP